MQMEIDGTNDIDKTNETEEQNMNKFEAERRFAQRMKDNYPPGTRIMLLQIGDDPRPIEPNTKGTVAVVDDMGTLHCNFDNGRQLGIVPVPQYRQTGYKGFGESCPDTKRAALPGKRQCDLQSLLSALEIIFLRQGRSLPTR